MSELFRAIIPELILVGMACALFLLGMSSKVGARKAAPWLAIAALAAAFWTQVNTPGDGSMISDSIGAFRVGEFAQYIKMLTAGIGVLLVLLAWPTNERATGNAALDYGHDAGEFFGLMLMSLAGVMLVAGANDIILLFLGIELASIPTYIMVSISRPIPAAQEAGVKYFFLGSMAAAILLFGLSWLYGTTGLLSLDHLAVTFSQTAGNASQAVRLGAWAQLAILLVILGLAFKIAAFPLHFYAGDVYQGAATPVTAFLSFVPKASGMVALIKILFVATGARWFAPDYLARLLWVLAVLTMSVGNALGLLQFNVKRVLAYSSIAHSGYMLAGLAALLGATDSTTQAAALQGVLFYLAAYGMTNAAAFGVLMLLPARRDPYRAPGEEPPATSAETFEDLAGQGRRHVALGLAMAAACFSLIGIPLTVGFIGKFYLIRPALDARMYWLVIATVVNAAVSAGYYLRIVGTMFLRPEPSEIDGSATPPEAAARPAMPIVLSISLSVAATLLFGMLLPATQVLSTKATNAADVGGSGMPILSIR